MIHDPTDLELASILAQLGGIKAQVVGLEAALLAVVERRSARVEEGEEGEEPRERPCSHPDGKTFTTMGGKFFLCPDCGKEGRIDMAIHGEVPETDDVP